MVLTMVLIVFNFWYLVVMVTAFLPSLLSLMENLGAHYSVNKDRDKLATKFGTCGFVNFLLIL